MEEQTLIYTGPVNNYENFWKFPFNICIWISYPLHNNFFKQVSKISGKQFQKTPDDYSSEALSHNTQN